MNRTTRIIFLVLLCIVLLPALFYSVYEISALNETEEMLSEIYERQLDAILFSINQYILDVAASWTAQIENNIPADGLYWNESNFNQFFRSNSSILSITITDSAFARVKSFPAEQQDYRAVMKGHKEKIERLFHYQTFSYQKLEPVVLSDSTLLILFTPASRRPLVVGIVINSTQFINSVIGKRLSDLARDEFVLAVVKQSSNTIVFSTSDFSLTEPAQQRLLWIFPDHVVKIKLKGTTVQQLAAERFNRNLVLILILDVVLILGAWFIFRTIKREMELVALKSDFVSNVSHELRTPLALIRMFAETLEMGRVTTEKKKKEYYSIILHETERLTRLINNILNFSRMESRSRKFNFRLSNVNEVVKSVLAIYSYQFEQMKFRVETILDNKLPKIKIDEEAIAEALHNLIDNAIKYSSTEKFLKVSTSASGNNVVITIADHGIGIPPEHHKKIFEKFYRVSHGLVHTAKGSGLGLAIVQHIVDSHSGTIAVESSVGKGSKFVLTLPINKPDRS